jgi:hypothetical protein
MTIDLDYLDDLNGEDLTREIVDLAKTHGAKVALRSAIDICNDPKAPAQARASAQRVILQLAGLLDRRDRGADLPKDIHEMTGDELKEAHARLRDREDSLRRSASRRAEHDPESVFD